MSEEDFDTIIEEYEQALANMQREYDKRGDRIEELEAKLEALDHAYDSIVQAFRFEALRTDDAESKLAKAVEIIAAAKEMYETAMLTGGGSPEAWVNHVRARNAFASTLAELSSVSCANSKGQDDA